MLVDVLEVLQVLNQHLRQELAEFGLDDVKLMDTFVSLSYDVVELDLETMTPVDRKTYAVAGLMRECWPNLVYTILHLVDEFPSTELKFHFMAQGRYYELRTTLNQLFPKGVIL